MKILQVTDAHLVPRERDMHGLNPFKRLSSCVNDICENHADAELCVFTGDLAHKGEIGAYEALSEILLGFPIPYHLMIGNHDVRENLLTVFPETLKDENGYIQSVADVDAGRLIFLDTVETGEKFGGYCYQRAEWLHEQLKDCGKKSAYLFLHHPPFDIGIPNVDRMRLLKGDNLLAKTIAPFSNIKHLFFGHVHRPTAGSWFGIPFSSFRGTAHQVALKLNETPHLIRSHEPPAYGVVLLGTDTTVIHFNDYLDNTAFVAGADVATKKERNSDPTKTV
jgi:3',5'-cyclic-AMP phosphodiesterase